MRRPFTGWHMAAILVAGFGVVVAVNMLMATLAISGFGGVVVENSYVASQKFNGWLAAARREASYGWTAHVGRNGDGRLLVTTSGLPEGARARVRLRHPLGRDPVREWTLIPAGGDRFVSAEVLPEGRWLVRLTLSSGNREKNIERPVG